MHQVVVVRVLANEAELAADALWGLGVSAIGEQSNGDWVELRTSFGDELAGAGERLTAAGLVWTVEEIDPAVADTWRASVPRFAASRRLAIRPAWLPPEHCDARHELVIEPGSTFGMGNHPTTLLCLRAVDRLIGGGERVLDVGTGSGVLAIGAAVLGASEVVAIDLGPHSPAITGLNARANGVGDWVTASATPLSEVEATFDLVLANILAPALIELAADLVRCTGAGGRLIVSGLLNSRYRHVLEALHGLRPVRIDVLDSWVSIELIAR